MGLSQQVTWDLPNGSAPWAVPPICPRLAEARVHPPVNRSFRKAATPGNSVDIESEEAFCSPSVKVRRARQKALSA